MDSHSQSVYDVPRSSVDSQPHSINKRSSIPSGYHNHLLRSRSQTDHDSGYNSMGKTPPTLDGPPVRLDKHPSIRRKRDSEPCLIRRSNSVQSPCSSYNDKEMSDPMFDDESSIMSRRTSHSDSPPDESEGYVTGHMDGDSADTMSNGQRVYDEVREGRTPDGHPYYIARSEPQGGGYVDDQYMRMIHPRSRNDAGYVVMKPARATSPQKSSTIPVPMPQQSNSGDEYNTLQHFQSSRQRVSNPMNYDTLPTIREKQGSERSRDNYVNHPLPQDLKGVVPRHYQPSYENHEGFRGRRGSHGQESYENAVPVPVNSNENNSNRH